MHLEIYRSFSKFILLASVFHLPIWILSSALLLNYNNNAKKEEPWCNRLFGFNPTSIFIFLCSVFLFIFAFIAYAATYNEASIYLKLSNIIFLFLLIVLVDMYLMLVLYSIITYKTDGQNHSLSAKEVTDRVLEKKFGRINSKNLTQRIMILVFAMLFFDHFVLNKFGWF